MKGRESETNSLCNWSKKGLEDCITITSQTPGDGSKPNYDLTGVLHEVKYDSLDLFHLRGYANFTFPSFSSMLCSMLLSMMGFDFAGCHFYLAVLCPIQIANRSYSIGPYHKLLLLFAMAHNITVLFMSVRTHFSCHRSISLYMARLILNIWKAIWQRHLFVWKGIFSITVFGIGYKKNVDSARHGKILSPRKSVRILINDSY